MLKIETMLCFVAIVSASRLMRRELEVVDTTQIVCANWFGNNLNWDNIPFQEMAPWGLTPQGCTEAIVEPYGEYSCATYDNSTNSFQSCNGDCADGVCVNGYATQEPSFVCYPGTVQDGTNCIPCAAGSYNANVGGVCIPCPAGTYTSESGSVACKPCEVGYFASSTGSQSCELCPEGYTTNGYGQVECVLTATQAPTQEPTVSCDVCTADFNAAGGCDVLLAGGNVMEFIQEGCSSCGSEVSEFCNSQSLSPTFAPTVGPSMSPTAESPFSATPTAAPTETPTFDGISLNVLYQKTRLTCLNGGQKIRQPCNGGKGTGCSYDTCVQHCIDESQCKFLFSIDGTKGCILYSSCDQTRVPYYSGTTVEIKRSPTVSPTQAPTIIEPTVSPSKSPSRSPSLTPTMGPSVYPSTSPSHATPNVSVNVLYQKTRMTCFNGGQKIRQPCNGGKGTGCSYDACVQHCVDETQCNFLFSIDGTNGCILYSSCDQTRVPYYSGTTVEIKRN